VLSMPVLVTGRCRRTEKTVSLPPCAPVPVSSVSVWFQQIASHGLFDVHVRAKGDTWIDDHHTNEDLALAFGKVGPRPLGSKSPLGGRELLSAPMLPCSCLFVSGSCVPLLFCVFVLPLFGCVCQRWPASLIAGTGGRPGGPQGHSPIWQLQRPPGRGPRARGAGKARPPLRPCIFPTCTRTGQDGPASVVGQELGPPVAPASFPGLCQCCPASRGWLLPACCLTWVWPVCRICRGGPISATTWFFQQSG
jgi:hypothetical protein